MQNSKTFIHVGLQKTASTYLQKIVFPRLEEVVFIGRPYTQENYAFNTLQYADNSLYEPNVLREEISRIQNVAQGKSILISDEQFSGCPFYGFINRGIIAERLSQIVPDAEIILFLRGQSDFIMSLYNQHVKTGLFDKPLNQSYLHRPGEGFSLEQWLEGERKWNKDNRFIHYQSVYTPESLRYSKLYSLYSDLFSKVHVFLYEDFKEDQKTCLLRLASVLSVKLPDDFAYEVKTQVNSRLNKYKLREQLLLNKLMNFDIQPQSKTARILAKLISVFTANNKDNDTAYVTSLLTECDIFSDNYMLNKSVDLGMQRFPKQYFNNNYNVNTPGTISKS
jgi:hypothetical protein